MQIDHEREPKPTQDQLDRDPTPEPSGLDGDRRRFLATLVALGLTQLSVSFVGSAPSARPRPADDAQPGCGTPNPNGTIVPDSTCAMPQGPGPTVYEKDDDCGKPSQTPQGNPTTMSDEDCGQAAPGLGGQAAHRDDACGKPMGAPGPPENVMRDGDCGKTKPVLPGVPAPGAHQDDDCGRYTHGHLNSDNDCTKIAVPFLVHTDDDCGKPPEPGGQLVVGDDDCGISRTGGPDVHKDDDCGKAGPGPGATHKDGDCGKPSIPAPGGGWTPHEDGPSDG
ncbi:MAG: hypothetical protein AAF682_19835 [Planctomycetota bacterium]